MGVTRDRTSKIATQLEGIVGTQGITPWEDLDGGMRSRISSALRPGGQVEWVVYPATTAELAEVMTCAHQHHWRVLVCGSGSKLSWGGLTDDIAIVVCTTRLNRLVDHAVGDLTVTAEAGIPFADLQATLATANQFLAIAPAYPTQATLGGIVATADAGALRHRYGGIRDRVIGISIVRADGQVAKAGGRVVKNVAGYDLMKLFTGSYGTLGILSELTLRVYPLPDAARTVVLMGATEAIAQVTRTLLASALTPTAVELLSPRLAQGLGWQAEMVLITRFQSIPASVETQAAQLLAVGQALNLTGTILVDAPEVNCWQRLQEPFESTPSGEAEILCKFGVLPSSAIATLNKIKGLFPGGVALIHAGSGLGTLRWRGDEMQAQTLLMLRKWCQSQSGFLSVLEAPPSLKQTLDLWGYPGNALHLMQNIKQQFDPETRLNPNRFVAGI